MSSDALHTRIAAICVVAFALIVLLCSVIPGLGNLSVPALLNKPVQVSEEVFPDQAFRNYVSTNIDTNKDGYLSNSEIVAVKSIGEYDHSTYKVTDPGLSNGNVSTLKGIETFYKLESLVAENNQITDLDISGNPLLRYIDMRGNETFAIGYTQKNAGAQLLVSEGFSSAGDIAGLDVVEVP